MLHESTVVRAVSVVIRRSDDAEEFTRCPIVMQGQTHRVAVADGWKPVAVNETVGQFASREMLMVEHHFSNSQAHDDGHALVVAGVV